MYNWKIVESYFKENPLIKQNIASYNEFIDKGMMKAVNQQDVMETRKEDMEIHLHKIRAEKPMITEADGAQRKILPHEARIRDRTYSAPLYMTISLTKEGKEIDKDEVYVGELPVMLKSKLCYLSGKDKEELIEAHEDPDDPGGYFIINGTERVLVGIENLAPNRIMTSLKEKNGKKTAKATVLSQKKGYRSRVDLKRRYTGELRINYRYGPRRLNLIHMLRALGLETKNDILKAFSDEQYIKNDILLNLEQVEDAFEDSGIDALGKRVAKGQKEEYRESTVKYHLNNNMLRHIGTDEDTWLNKAYYLVRMAEKCIRVAHGKEEPCDRDHYANKRISISGGLMQEQFKSALYKFIKDIKYQVDRASQRKRKLKIKTLTRPDALTRGINFGFSTGTWVGGRTGVSQVLDRTSYLAQISHLRRITSPLGRGKRKIFKARDLHGTHYGKLCPHETPEGPNVGMRKNLAVGCKIASQEINEDEVKESLNQLGVEKISK